MSFEGKGLRSAGDKPTFVLTSRNLPRTRDTVEFYAGDLAQFRNGHPGGPRSCHHLVCWGGVVSGECLPSRASRRGFVIRSRHLDWRWDTVLRAARQRHRSPSGGGQSLRAAWWSFVTRCEGIVASHGTPPPNQGMERTATRQENYKGEIRK